MFELAHLTDKELLLLKEALAKSAVPIPHAAVAASLLDKVNNAKPVEKAP